VKARLTANTLGVVLLSGLACVVVSSQASPGSQGQAPAALPGGAPLAAQAVYVRTDVEKIPNPCTSCHTDRTTAWARQTLVSWAGVSPSRVN